MGDALKVIRDFTIILAIYLYFIAWVYVHFYYHQFGISTDAIKIDYNSYLVFSYNVVTSVQFICWLKTIALVVLSALALTIIIWWLSRKVTALQKFISYAGSNHFVLRIWQLIKKYRLLLLVIICILVFPKLFSISREVAIANYREDRQSTQNLKTIEFIFRKDAEFLSPTVVLDSSLSPQNNLFADITIIKNDTQQILRLLGESDQYYIVLQQRPFNKQLGALPTGYVYFIDKKDVLLAKIVLRSL